MRPRCCGRRTDTRQLTACSRVFSGPPDHSRGIGGCKPTDLLACRYHDGALPSAFAVYPTTSKITHQPEPSLPPHQQKRLNLNRHRTPPHNRKAGGHVLRKHVNPTNEYIERRFTRDRHPVVSFFTSKEEAERAIHTVIRDNAPKIDTWLKNAANGSSVYVEGYSQEKRAVVIENANRQHKAARRIQVRIVKKNTMG
ncbi:MAG: RNase A-like domain-containing protein [Acetobacter syzygii]|uniref:RNase A-like domain-containing protein n=1 Tax=Acetobacter syzygii TaxID=146476 RepID=UPI0039E96F60